MTKKQNPQYIRLPQQGSKARFKTNDAIVGYVIIFKFYFFVLLGCCELKLHACYLACH